MLQDFYAVFCNTKWTPHHTDHQAAVEFQCWMEGPEPLHSLALLTAVVWCR